MDVAMRYDAVGPDGKAVPFSASAQNVTIAEWSRSLDSLALLAGVAVMSFTLAPGLFCRR